MQVVQGLETRIPSPSVPAAAAIANRNEPSTSILPGLGARIGTVCILFVAVFYLSTIREGHDWGDDFSQYILHAANLASGAPYAPTRYLYNPDNPVTGPQQYPPGFPLHPPFAGDEWLISTPHCLPLAPAPSPAGKILRY